MQNEKLLEKLKFVKKVKSLSEAKAYLADLNTDENDVLIYTENNRILCFPGVIKTRQIEDMWEKAQKWCDGDSRDLLLFYYAGTKPCMTNAALVEFLVFGQNITKKHLETHAEAMILRLMHSESEEEIIEILQLGLASEEALRSILNVSIQEEKPMITAYILDVLKDKKKESKYIL